MAQQASGQQSASKASWLNRAAEMVKRQPGPYDNSFPNRNAPAHTT
jgi:hypothetical protein